MESLMSINYEKFINKLTINQTLLLLKIVQENNKKGKNKNLDNESNEYSQLLSMLTKDDIIHLKKMYLNNDNIIDFYHYFSNLSHDLDKNKYFESIIFYYTKIYKKLV
jgi:hypothetical protein